MYFYVSLIIFVECEYGDHVLACKSANCGRELESGELYDIQCCGTCNYTVSTLFPVTTTTTDIPSALPPNVSIICR